MERPNARDAIARIKELPTLPAVLGRILETAFDPDSSALELGRHIAADQALSAKLLKVVNSPYYGHFRQIDSITTAVVILGFVEIRNMVFTATAFRALQDSASGYDRLQLWRHSLASAVAAERFSNMLHLDKDGAFVAALLHDIGKVAFDSLFAMSFETAVEEAHRSNRPLYEVEEEELGINHAEAGGLLAEHWNLPVTIVEAIRFHHAPERETVDPVLTSLTTLGNYVAYRAGFPEQGNPVPPELPECVTNALGICETQWDNVAQQVRDREDHINSILGVLQH